MKSPRCWVFVAALHGSKKRSMKFEKKKKIDEHNNCHNFGWHWERGGVKRIKLRFVNGKNSSKENGH